MGWGVKFVVLLAALSVLVVLITPAPDELPCTAGCKSHQPPAFLANVSAVLVPAPRLEGRPVPAATRFFGVADVLALTSKVCPHPSKWRAKGDGLRRFHMGVTP